MNSAQVTRYFHGNTWFINYDELEKVILRHLKAVKKRKKRKCITLSVYIISGNY